MHCVMQHFKDFICGYGKIGNKYTFFSIKCRSYRYMEFILYKEHFYNFLNSATLINLKTFFYCWEMMKVSAESFFKIFYKHFQKYIGNFKETWPKI